MSSHEEFRELCAAATAGELSADEHVRLEAHLARCADCRQAMHEYEAAAQMATATFAQDFAAKDEAADRSWSTENAEQTFFRRLEQEQKAQKSERINNEHPGQRKLGKRFTYHPSHIQWREIWVPFAAAVLLAAASGITAYKTGVKQGTDVAQTAASPANAPDSSLEERASDAGYERVQLEAKLAENAEVIVNLKRELADESRAIEALKSAGTVTAPGSGSKQPGLEGASVPNTKRDEDLAAAQAKLAELQKTIATMTTVRAENARQEADLGTKVDELTELVRDREQSLAQRDAELAKGEELLAHDRDIRELMGARQLYMTDVRDVSGTGTDKTYGRVFYTKGKSLIFYAFDLDAERGVRNASSFQAWGRRGPDKQQALSLGIFYEDNVSKKRWVLKASDPKTLEDIDAVFVTVEPSGGSHHPSGKQLLFAYLRVGPNHP
jgi:putative zinc finger protein